MASFIQSEDVLLPQKETIQKIDITAPYDQNTVNMASPGTTAQRHADGARPRQLSPRTKAKIEENRRRALEKRARMLAARNSSLDSQLQDLQAPLAAAQPAVLPLLSARGTALRGVTAPDEKGLESTTTAASQRINGVNVVISQPRSRSMASPVTSID
jgi:hypothetical protein